MELKNFKEYKLLLKMQIEPIELQELLTVSLYEIVLPFNKIAFISNTKEWTCLDDFELGATITLPDIWAIHNTLDEFFNSLENERIHYDLFRRNNINALFYFEPILISDTIKSIVDLLINNALQDSNMDLDEEEMELIKNWESKMN